MNTKELVLGRCEQRVLRASLKSQFFINFTNEKELVLGRCEQRVLRASLKSQFFINLTNERIERGVLIRQDPLNGRRNSKNSCRLNFLGRVSHDNRRPL